MKQVRIEIYNFFDVKDIDLMFSFSYPVDVVVKIFSMLRETFHDDFVLTTNHANHLIYVLNMKIMQNIHIIL